MRNFLVFWRGRMFLGGKKFNTEPVAQIHESTFLVTGAQPDFFSSLRGLAKMEKKCDLWEASLRISLPFPWPSPACQLTLVRPAQLAWLLRREIQSKRWLSGIKGRVRHHPTQYPPLTARRGTIAIAHRSDEILDHTKCMAPRIFIWIPAMFVLVRPLRKGPKGGLFLGNGGELVSTNIIKNWSPDLFFPFALF